MGKALICFELQENTSIRKPNNLILMLNIMFRLQQVNNTAFGRYGKGETLAFSFFGNIIDPSTDKIRIEIIKIKESSIGILK